MPKAPGVIDPEPFRARATGEAKHSGQPKVSAERVLRDIMRATRRHFSAEDKIRILLEGLCGDLERHIKAFVEHYNHQRYHEGLKNVMPADAYFGRVKAIIQQRERIKRNHIEYRRLQHRKIAARYQPN